MSKLLSVQDMLDIAMAVWRKLGGRIGQLPLFKLVQWTNERMGLDSADRNTEIASLIFQAQQETLRGEKTADAISFDSVMENLQNVLAGVEKAVREARSQPD